LQWTITGDLRLPLALEKRKRRLAERVAFKTIAIDSSSQNYGALPSGFVPPSGVAGGVTGAGSVLSAGGLAGGFAGGATFFSAQPYMETLIAAAITKLINFFITSSKWLSNMELDS
jgi:hypothetical protein